MKNVTKITLLALSALTPLTIMAPTKASQQTNWRVTVRIDEIRCIETEDLLGSDEFYTLSAITLGLPDGRQVVRTRTTSPVSINNGNKKNGTTLFDFIVPSGTTFSGELMGLDEDVDKDWSRVDEKFSKAGEDLTGGLKGLGGKKGAAIGSLLKASIGIIGGISALDEDDILGQEGLPEMTVLSKRTYTKTAPFSNSAYFGSDWSYKVRYTIKIEPSYNQPNI
jgi:hypothetical protein